MSEMPTPCDLGVIRRFVDHLLSDVDEACFEEHLSKCSHCRERLQAEIADDKFWKDLAGGLRVDPALESTQSTQSAHRLGDGARGRADVSIVLKSLAPTDDPEMLGRLGTYEIMGVIGAGGMGVVLKAYDPPLQRIVAIKVMAPQYANSDAARQRFAREARAAAAIVHPNTIDIYAVSEFADLPYFVMPYSRGTNLQKRIDEHGPLPLLEILRIGSQIAAGLAAAHAQGLVHRDIKPSNILIEEGIDRLVITDFGLARAYDDVALTRTGIIAGTPQYMSPEQARGDSIDPRSDLFSMGSVMYALCTGQPPFHADNAYGILRRITDDEPVPIQKAIPKIPDWTCRIISKLMEKKREDRFESAEVVHTLLEACVAHIQDPLRNPLPPELGAQHSRSTLLERPVLSGLFIVIVLGLMSFAGRFLFFAQEHERLPSDSLSVSSPENTGNGGNESNSLVPKDYRLACLDFVTVKIPNLLPPKGSLVQVATSGEIKLHGLPNIQVAGFRVDDAADAIKRVCDEVTERDYQVSVVVQQVRMPQPTLLKFSQNEPAEQVLLSTLSNDGTKLASVIERTPKDGSSESKSEDVQVTIEIIDPIRDRKISEFGFYSADEIDSLDELPETDEPKATAMQFSNDGNLLAVATSNGQLRLFDVEAGRFVRSFHDVRIDTWSKNPPNEISTQRVLGSVTSLDFSNDGKWLAVGGTPFVNDRLVTKEVNGRKRKQDSPVKMGGAAQVWNANTGTLAVDVKNFDSISGIHFSHDDAKLAVFGNIANGSSVDSKVVQWDLKRLLEWSERQARPGDVLLVSISGILPATNEVGQEAGKSTVRVGDEQFDGAPIVVDSDGCVNLPLIPPIRVEAMNAIEIGLAISHKLHADGILQNGSPCSVSVEFQKKHEEDAIDWELEASGGFECKALAYSLDDRQLLLSQDRFDAQKKSWSSVVKMVDAQNCRPVWARSIGGTIGQLAFTRDGRSVMALNSGLVIEFFTAAKGTTGHRVQAMDCDRQRVSVWTRIDSGTNSDTLVVDGFSAEGMSLRQVWRIEDSDPAIVETP